MSGWTLPRGPVTPYAPTVVASPGQLVGEAVSQAPLNAAKMRGEQATAEADAAEAQSRKNLVPLNADLAKAQAQAQIAGAQNDVALAPTRLNTARTEAATADLKANMGTIGQYAQLFSSTPGLAENPAALEMLKPIFQKLGLSVPMGPHGIDVEAMVKMTHPPQVPWEETSADELKKWQQQPPEVRRAHFPPPTDPQALAAYEAWVSKPAIIPMTDTTLRGMETHREALMHDLGKGEGSPASLLALLRSQREQLLQADMSPAAIDEMLSDDKKELADYLKVDLAGKKTEAQIQHYKDLGINMAAIARWKDAVLKENVRKFDKTYVQKDRIIADNERKMMEKFAMDQQRLSLAASNLALRATSVRNSSDRNELSRFKLEIDQLESKRKNMATQYYQNLRSMGNMLRPPAVDSQIMQQTELLKNNLFGYEDASGNHVPGINEQLDTAMNAFKQNPGAVLQMMGGGTPVNNGPPQQVTKDRAPGPGFKLQQNGGQYRWFNSSTGQSVMVP